MPRSRANPRVLNARQQAFAREYALAGDRRAAAIRAGYRDPKQAGRDLMRRPDVLAEIREARLAIAETPEAQAARAEAREAELLARLARDPVLRELGRIAFFDLSIYTRIKIDGTAEVDLPAMVRDGAMAAVRDLTLDTITRADGSVEQRLRIKLADKRMALMRLLAVVPQRSGPTERHLGQLDVLEMRLEDIARLQAEKGLGPPPAPAEEPEFADYLRLVYPDGDPGVAPVTAPQAPAQPPEVSAPVLPKDPRILAHERRVAAAGGSERDRDGRIRQWDEYW